MSIVLFIVILVALILVHEFGHFIVAKRAGVRVDEFGIGFPPRLFGVRWGETLYSINAIPFGGFVKIFGETPDEESLEGPHAARSFVRKPRSIQALVLVAGVLFNILFAWLLISLGYMVGFPTSTDYQGAGEVKDARTIVTRVLPNSPAEKAGLKPGDVIVGLSGGGETSGLAPQELTAFIEAHPEGLELLFEQGGEEKKAELVPTEGIVPEKKIIGIGMDEVGVLKLPLHLALFEGAKLTVNATREIAVGLFMFVKSLAVGTADFSAVTGPVGIVGLVGLASESGFISLLSLTALISINLALINLIPFPALDGGRLLFVGIEAVKGSPIKSSVANTLNAIGFALLITLMVVVTYHDIARLISG